MKAGYSTNSFGDVDPLDALSLLCEQGYKSLAITPDRNMLNPFEKTFASEVRIWQDALAKAQMRCVIETGARYLLDSRRKHHPTLLSDAHDDRCRRIEFLRRVIDLAAELNADCVSLWSGAVDSDTDEELLWQKLTDGVGEVLDYASRCGVVLGFEPEPGMFIDTVARAQELLEKLGRPKLLGFTVDIGHLECLGERPLANTVRAVADRTVNVHLDDMIVCRHEHLPLGKGDVDYVPVFRELLAAHYQGGLHVELPRQSHRWHETSKESYEYIHRVLGLIS